jgi:hypothetical protein
MAEIVRTLKKQGAKNREINESIKEVMKTIMEKRAQLANATKIKLELQPQQALAS